MDTYSQYMGVLDIQCTVVPLLNNTLTKGHLLMWTKLFVCKVSPTKGHLSNKTDLAVRRGVLIRRGLL